VPRIDDYKNALEIAKESFRKKDPGHMARNSGALCSPDSPGGILELPYLNRRITITWPEGVMAAPEGTKGLSLQEQGLIMHYLIQAKGAPLTETWITFREIPSGEFYYSAFVQRAKNPLVKAFGHHPGLLLDLGRKMGGTPGEEGDASICFKVFPYIPVCLILWTGDEEFPPDGNLLFDASISQYLPAEDIAVLSGLVVYPLIALGHPKK
jgi:Domain of unknown function (DUF3786)